MPVDDLLAVDRHRIALAEHREHALAFSLIYTVAGSDGNKKLATRHGALSAHSHGRRASEMLRAQVGDYDPRTGLITIHQRKDIRPRRAMGRDVRSWLQFDSDEYSRNDIET